MRKPRQATWVSRPLDADDHGLLVGDGVFETLKAVGHRAFAITRHLDRLDRSAAALGLTAPDRDTTVAAINEVLADLGVRPAVVRVTWTSGPGPLGSARGAGPGTLVVQAAPLTVPGGPVAVALVPWPRNERGLLAGVKTTSYAENAAALAWARQRGAGEAIFADTRGRLCEGTGTNVVLRVDDRLVTPSLACGCLAGVTRALLLETGLVEEAEVDAAALAEADEAFLCSTTRDVQQIGAVDGVALGDGEVGDLTREAAKRFADLVAAHDDP